MKTVLVAVVYHLAIVTWLVLLALQTASANEACTPTKIVDGDTIHFIRSGEKIKVRIAGYDAPERGQELGPSATKKLSELLKNPECKCYKVDKYQRSVCRVYADGADISTAMIRAGFGCIDERYEGEGSPELQQANRDALEAAQRERRGIWSDAVPECGKQYRDRIKK